MQRLGPRHPIRLAVIVTLVYALGLLAWVLVRPPHVTATTNKLWMELGLDVTRILIPVVFLTLLGWWQSVGLAGWPRWSVIVPALPLALYPLFPLVFGPGITITDPAKVALLVVTYLAVAFGEEATFRGIALRSLLPQGIMRAAILSSILFGLMHLVNIAGGDNVVNVGFQVLSTALIGFAFASVALVTGSIWPLILIHFAMDFVNAIQTSPVVPSTTTHAGPDLTNGLLNVALAAVFAAYGYWLLHKHIAEQVPKPASRRSDHALVHQMQ